MPIRAEQHTRAIGPVGEYMWARCAFAACQFILALGKVLSMVARLPSGHKAAT